MNKRLDSFVTALGLFAGSIVIGIIWFLFVENMDFVDATYMTIITISTVGFTEVKELSHAGRIFTSIYILMNLGIFAYVVSVFSTYFFEGKLRSIFKDYVSVKEINKMNQHVIVCGFGRNGKQACAELKKSGKDFIIIELNAEIHEMIPEDMKSLLGDATKDDKLKEIGIEKASSIIITTPSDASNVFITLTARHLNPNLSIISRASNPETESKLYKAGADKVIMPDVLGGMFMAQLITKPIVIEFLDLLNGVSETKYYLEEVSFQNLKPAYRDKTLAELDIDRKVGVTVVGVKDDLKGLIPSPGKDTFIGEDDHLIILGSDNKLDRFFQEYTSISRR
ncbi:MAG: potassium channel family protein [Cytophagales bacterium]|nr:potassium channel family protein [Cytophagales bacterium]